MKNTLKLITLFSLITLSSAAFAVARNFPKGPELSITPGKLCVHPNARRYPERIAYCDRDVDYQTKEVIIEEYDQKFGYNIENMPREDFKIDHFIPLCMGGDNDSSNLWPQHKSVYLITDPLEPLLCGKMAEGRLKQKDAVAMMIQAKTHLDQVPEIMRQVESL
jgi:hypothetical protein